MKKLSLALAGIVLVLTLTACEYEWCEPNSEGTRHYVLRGLCPFY